MNRKKQHMMSVILKEFFSSLNRYVLVALIFSFFISAQGREYSFQKIYSTSELYKSVGNELEFSISDPSVSEEVSDPDHFKVNRTTYVGLRYTRDHKTDGVLSKDWTYKIRVHIKKLGDSHQLKKELKYLVLLSSESVLPMLEMVFSA